jgi:hypothetical protein
MSISTNARNYHRYRDHFWMRCEETLVHHIVCDGANAQEGQQSMVEM